MMEVLEEVRGVRVPEIRSVSMEVEKEHVWIIGDAGGCPIPKMGVQIEDQDLPDPLASEVMNTYGNVIDRA